MSTDKTWTVFCITRIESKQSFVFILSDAITLVARHKKLARELLEFGPREFCWEQSGAFNSMTKARSCRDEWLTELAQTGELRSFLEHTNIGRPPAPADPRVHRLSPQHTQQEFVKAARDLLKSTKEQRDAYMKTYVPPPERGPERKSFDEKQQTRFARNQRRRERYRTEAGGPR
jgi:hypothetical protein